MADLPTTPASAPVQRREKIHFSLWDSVMRFGDLGIALWSLLMLAFLYLPIVVLVWFSFNYQRLNLTWDHFSTRWYTMKPGDEGVGLIWDEEIMNPTVGHYMEQLWRWPPHLGVLWHLPAGALPTSVYIGVLSTLIAVFIGTLGAFALERFEFRSKSVWDGLNYTKIVIAEIVAGVSTLLFFVQLYNWLNTYWGYEGASLWGFNVKFPQLGFLTVLISHVAWSIPFVVVIVRARLKGFDKALEEAAADLGSTPVGVFVRVTLPVIMPGIFAAALLALALSFDDFITTFFTAGTSTTTLPLLIWSKVRMGITPEINALSTFLVAFSVIVVLILELKSHISEDII